MQPSSSRFVIQFLEMIFIESRFQSLDVAYELHHILDNNFKFEQTNKNKGRLALTKNLAKNGTNKEFNV